METATVPITVGQAPTVITWPTPTPITYGTPLSGFQLDATASSGIVSVPLDTYYNVSGIYSSGSIYSTGGFDNDGYSYSTTTLGSTAGLERHDLQHRSAQCAGAVVPMKRGVWGGDGDPAATGQFTTCSCSGRWSITSAPVRPSP